MKCNVSSLSLKIQSNHLRFFNSSIKLSMNQFLFICRVLPTDTTKDPFKTTPFRAVMPKKAMSEKLHSSHVNYYLHICGTVKPFTNQEDVLSTFIIKQQEWFPSV